MNKKCNAMIKSIMSAGEHASVLAVLQVVQAAAGTMTMVARSAYFICKGLRDLQAPKQHI
jgi:DNA-binding phage protein